MVRIVTYNVNSIKARLQNVTEWLRETSPDIVCLQEIKCVDEAFPAMEIEDLGYNIAVHGQKTYNGVAILSKFPLEVEQKGLPGDDSDEQARYVEAVISVDEHVLRVASLYLPNGGEPDGPRWGYKMAFFDRLYAHMQELFSYNEKTLICGDYNVAPEDIDVYAPDKLRGTTCFHPDEQAKWRSLVNLGYTDCWRAVHPKTQAFTWWDYRGGGYQNGKGMRIDHILASPQAADIVTGAGIDEDTRGREKASDHAPMWVELV